MPFGRSICVGLLAIHLLLIRAVAAESNDTVDVLLRGGTILKGDGNPGEFGDVAIREGRIVAVGRFETGQVAHEIDCTGLVVCPGFIDLHNHSDRQVLEKSTRSLMCYVTQGCTTIVTGNCGGGPIDVAAYYDKIDEYGVGVNVAHLLPQGALRDEVIGSVQRQATTDDLERMKQLADQAMRDGAWGMTTGLIYVPSAYAGTDELAAIASVVGRHGGVYASHIRNENVELLHAIEEALDIGRKARVPVHISHFKSSGKNSWGLVRVAAKIIEKARSEGHIVTADQYPYTASSTSLQATLIPAWARAGGRDKLVEQFDNADSNQRIRKAMAEKLDELDDGLRLQIASYAKEPSWSGRRLAEIANDRSMTVMDLAIEIINNGGASVVNHSINEEDVRHVMSLDWVATASDGSAKLPGATVPHPRSYGTFPRKVGHYSWDQKVVPLEHAIRSCTGLPADIVGLRDRGYLRANYWADVVVFDPARIRDTATFNDPHKHSVGIEHVFVNGKPVLSGGVATGMLMGRALRHESAEVLDLASGRDPESNSTLNGSLFDEIRQHDDGVAIWWTGHNGWLIKSDGLLIGTDLVLDDPSREHASPISAAMLASELDISFVTHVHGDHFNGPTSRLLAEKSECLFVLPKSCMEKARDYGIPTSRIVVATPRRTMHVKDIKVQPLRAIHGNRKGAVYFDANLDDCGYVIHIGGKSIMQPGDSVLLEDHLFLKHVDVLFFSPTEHNMQIENSITLINALEPEYIVPQHRDTYPVTSQNRFWTHAYTYDVRRRLAKDLQKRYRVVDMGARIDVTQ